jgi:hypothetical protein
VLYSFKRCFNLKTTDHSLQAVYLRGCGGGKLASGFEDTVFTFLKKDWGINIVIVKWEK